MGLFRRKKREAAYAAEDAAEREAIESHDPGGPIGRFGRPASEGVLWSHGEELSGDRVLDLSARVNADREDDGATERMIQEEQREDDSEGHQ